MRIPVRGGRHAHERAWRETPYQGRVVLKAPQPSFRRQRHQSASEVVERGVFANVVFLSGQRPRVEANDALQTSRVSVAVDVVQGQRWGIGWPVYGKPFASEERDSRVLPLLCDGVKAPNETSTSDRIDAALAVCCIQSGEQPIDFSLYETI